MWQFWLILSGFFLIIEIMTVGFLVFWFAVASLFAMVASFFTTSVVAQTAVFLIASVILLFATRPFVSKVTHKDDNVKTNVNSIEGKIGKVIQDIDSAESSGQIKVNGEVWSAKSYDSSFIAKDTEIVVENVDGVKAVVKPLK